MKKQKMIAAGMAAAMLAVSAAGCGGKTEKVSYNWSNVAMGGGGFVTGMVYSEAQEDLIYARTDIGGAYRWNEPEQRWVAITDHLGSDNWNLIGIESIAADPVDANRVYAMCGTYMGENGAVLSSDDYGTTWSQFDLPFGCGGNCAGRGTGERLMVNPRNNAEVYMGSRTDGLWKTGDYGKTWAKVESFPVKGDYQQGGFSLGVMWVEFHPISGDAYAGVAMKNGECIYRSSDNGATWEALPANVPGLYPIQADFSTDGTLYLTYSSNGGPNESQGEGAIYKYDGSSFTDITPNLDDGRYGTFGGVSTDKQDPNTLVVSTQFYWSDPGDNIYRSTDGGATWTGMHNNKTGEKNYVMDVSRADWLNWGLEEAKLGWWMSDININPFNSDEVMYGTGATIYTTQNMTALGSGTPVTVAFDAYGLEETAVFQMMSPNYKDGEPQLYSIMGDLTGFSHLDVTQCPDEAHFMGCASGGTAVDLDVAYENANTAVYTIKDVRVPAIWYTQDGGSTWGSVAPPEAVEGGKVSVAADGSSFIWNSKVTGNSNIYIYNFADGAWYYVEGLGYGAEICADRVNPKMFYAAYNGKFFVSNDGGYTFQDTGAMIMDEAEPQGVVGKEGHVWLCASSLVMYSEDGGKTFNMIKDVAFNAIGFGAPKDENSYPTIFGMGEAGEQGDGIYYSTDKGATWVRINDDQHLFGNLTHYISGDSKVFGRVYFATNGRGVVMGDIAE